MSTTLQALLTGGRRPRCYIASPLGFSEATRDYYRRVYLPTLAEFVEPIDPWSLTKPEEIEIAAKRDELRLMFLKVGERNTQAIETSDLIIAQLDGQEVDSGTAAEIGYATARGTPCLAVRSDLRQSGEPQMACNLQVEGFIVQSGGWVSPSLGHLVTELRRLSK